MTERLSTLIQSALAMTIGILQFTAVAAQPADYDVGSLHLAQPWSRATPKGASAGAAYLTVTNNGAVSDRLSCADSDAAAQCQIHTMSMENGVMKMRPVEGGLEIKPGETVTLKPGGDHLMLMKLKHPLEAGKTVEATLQFDKAGTIKVAFPIRDGSGRARSTGGRRLDDDERPRRPHDAAGPALRTAFPGRAARASDLSSRTCTDVRASFCSIFIDKSPRIDADVVAENV
jgi:periplasmic copper chaperone A